jgi:hypothetical protein
MTKFNYSLNQNDYTLKNALFWGVCLGHWQKTKIGALGNRCVHAIIAALHLLPIIGQISSLAERFIVIHFSDKTTTDITQKKITQIKAVKQTPNMPMKESVKELELKPVRKIAEEPVVKPTIEVIKKPAPQPVKGVEFKNFQDIKDYYDVYLLPKKSKLSTEEFSERSVYLLQQLINIATVNLDRDIRTGVIILTEDHKLLNSSRVKPEWLNEFESICKDIDPSRTASSISIVINHALMLREVHKLDKHDSSQEFKIASWLCEAVQKKEPPSNELIRKTQKKALSEIMADPQWYTISSEQLKEKIRIHKQMGILKACGIAAQEHSKYLAFLDHFESGWKHMQEKSKEILDHKQGTLSLPPLAMDKCSAFYNTLLQTECTIFFKDYIKGLLETFSETDLQLLKKEPAKQLELLKLIDEWLEKIEKKILGVTTGTEDFYQKWGPALKKEMMQGFKNSGEILGSGVCYALATRWAVGELKKEEYQDLTDILRELEIGSIEAQDRFNQVFSHTKKGDAIFEKKLGVKRAEILNEAKNVSGKDALKDYIKKLISDPKFDIQYNGVGRFSFWWEEDGKIPGHAISICAHENRNDPSESIYRIIDPNYGAFQFYVKPDAVNGELAKKQFIDCLSDLLLHYKDKMYQISCRCFEV